jgi:hypothetical protein
MNQSRIALYIDAENMSPFHMDAIVAHAGSLGKITIARCYGNSAAQDAWAEANHKFYVKPALIPPANKAGKNASDFAMVIDVVAAVHDTLCDQIVIVSSDIDFVQLANHVREQGMPVHGIMEAKANDSLKRAFDTFKLVGEPNPVPEIDTTTFRAACEKILPKGASTPLSQLGNQLRGELGELYMSGNGRLSKMLSTLTGYEVSGNSVKRIN